MNHAAAPMQPLMKLRRRMALPRMLIDFLPISFFVGSLTWPVSATRDGCLDASYQLFISKTTFCQENVTSGAEAKDRIEPHAFHDGRGKGCTTERACRLACLQTVAAFPVCPIACEPATIEEDTQDREPFPHDISRTRPSHSSCRPAAGHASRSLCLLHDADGSRSSRR